ncbi:unnamed protein product [Peronospora belbahrii]|uniref:HTH psq-type domain-containing protein n=1 Tax=Peronospora belbahrii TaxID=622444 RepID=A0AAU9KS71_9STRA|nr:unnamed protein product [Peronospora belbahrii]CAH0514207.1 unnamed protein product [Peronospora belbahrii]
MSSNTVRRDWSPGTSPMSDRVWAQAIHAVVERRLTLRQASQAFGLQQTALHRLVRQHTLQQLRQPPSTRSLCTSPTNSDDSRLTALAIASSNKNSETSNTHYVFPRLNPVALCHNSPHGVSLPAVAPLATVMVPPPVCELTPEINDEVVAVLREQFVQQQYDDYETSDGRYERLEGYADADIADVARAIVGHNGRRILPPNFPSANWLATFKRENGFADMDEMTRCGDRTSSGARSKLSSQYQQQGHNNCNYEAELQQYELEEQHRHEDKVRYGSHKYHQPAAPPSPSQSQRSPMKRHVSYIWDDVNGTMDEGERLKPLQRQRLYPPQHQLRDNGKFRRSPSAGSRNGHSDRYGLPDSNCSDRNYRQSNLVPAKVWEAAMEDVAIHGMSLRNAAKAHGVHFAALHRRLKKRQQYKLSMPCEPNYIPFEDEAGVVRVIHARAEMGVLLTFTELVDLLKRTALKHRSHLPGDVATAIVRRFQSRVEQSVRHLIVDWPALPNNVLYRLRDTGSPVGDKCGLSRDFSTANVGKNSLPSIISRSSGEASSSGSSSSLSPHARSASGGGYPVTHKSPAGTSSKLTWDNVKASNKISDDDENVLVATVSPPSDDSEPVSSQPCVMLRL